MACSIALVAAAVLCNELSQPSLAMCRSALFVGEFRVS
jgi:hypothetical protein